MKVCSLHGTIQYLLVLPLFPLAFKKYEKNIIFGISLHYSMYLFAQKDREEES
jgi:hypothetical protein